MIDEPARLNYARPLSDEERRQRRWRWLGVQSVVVSYALPVVYAACVVLSMVLNPQRIDEPGARYMFANSILEAGLCMLCPLPVVLLVAGLAWYKTRNSGLLLALVVWFPVAVGLSTSMSLIIWQT